VQLKLKAGQTMSCDLMQWRCLYFSTNESELST